MHPLHRLELFAVWMILLHTLMLAILGEEGGVCPEVDAATDDI